MAIEAALAAHRFGLGANQADLATANSDPRGWLKWQLSSLDPALQPFAGNKRSGDILRELPGEVEQLKGTPEGQKQIREMGREMFLGEMRPWMKNAFDTKAPFLERLVWFWSNHFTISVQKARLIYFAGTYEREAIRPNVLGKFEDLLLASVRHPAMLLYLDNAQSIGPNSRAGQFAGKGLNENHAREIMELHTLGVDGGYNQDDVIALAKILTGWSLERGDKVDNPTGFKFYENRHEPGAKVLLGKSYAEGGEREGFDALRDLGRHPATARHIATKLARHFIADEPPPQAVARLERVFRDTGGDLRALAMAIIDEPAAWHPELSKVRSPIEYVVAAVRLLGGGNDTLGEQQFKGLAESLRIMGQIPFTASSPKGWPDVASAWAGPAAVMERAQWAHLLASRLPQKPDPVRLGEMGLGPLLSAATHTELGRAADATQGLALLIASPEFQRR